MVTEKQTDVAEAIERVPDGSTLKDAVMDAALKGQATTGYETMTPWETIKTFKISTLACFAAAFSAATDGYQIGMNSGIVANKAFVKQFATTVDAKGQPALASPVLAGWSSVQSVGQIIGMVGLSFVSSHFGRKVAMYTYWIILACSIVAESVGRSWQAWLVAKLLAGIGVGSMQSILPTYISEVAPVRIRGALLMMYSLWWTLGTFFAYTAMQTLNKHHPDVYLISIYTQWAQVGIMLIIYIFLPESPAWCVTRGYMDKARTSLKRLNKGVRDFNLDHQLQVLVLTVEHEQAVAVEQRREHWYSIFRGVDGFRTVVTLWTNLSQQFIGNTLFGTFGTYFFQQAGLADPFKIKCITEAVQIATVIIVVLISDYSGRRLIACSATTLMWLACVAIGILGVARQVKATNYLLVFFACLWNVGVTANGAAGWGYIGEISSQRLRPYTAGFGAATTCVVGVVMGQLTPYMVNSSKWNWGLKTGWFYAGVGLPFAAGMWLLIPETAGRSAAELDELFERKINPWRFAKTETAIQRVVQNEKEQS
ncbi:Hexose transporter [Sporothrix schenckii 1099-18]|uniref:Hexose transporter n=1 Tax=Sporothrix schenckii 1099-18 TaxID=1397361 RepID=A0A0F2M3E9_SPOSC|nr:Hexose transporter [Sporothrix schenckii 1099-18]KJR83634.1 Hexose transporter [Sporothrix schenckii 1099-18]